MRFPLDSALRMGAYIAKNKLFPRPEWQRDPQPPPAGDTTFPIWNGSAAPAQAAGGPPHPMLKRRFPLVLMLEPLHACNLTCTGCGRIREYEDTIAERLPLEKCLAAMDE